MFPLWRGFWTSEKMQNNDSEWREIIGRVIPRQAGTMSRHRKWKTGRLNTLSPELKYSSNCFRSRISFRPWRMGIDEPGAKGLSPECRRWRPSCFLQWRSCKPGCCSAFLGRGRQFRSQDGQSQPTQVEYNVQLNLHWTARVYCWFLLRFTHPNAEVKLNILTSSYQACDIKII